MFHCVKCTAVLYSAIGGHLACVCLWDLVNVPTNASEQISIYVLVFNSFRGNFPQRVALFDNMIKRFKESWFLFISEGGRETTKGELLRDLVSADSLPQCLQRPGLG